MKCQNCHEEVPDSAKVCGYCGTKLEKTAESKICKACGAQVPAGTKVCGECGAAFDNASKKKAAAKPVTQAKLAEKIIKPEKKIEKAVKKTVKPADKPAEQVKKQIKAVKPIPLKSKLAVNKPDKKEKTERKIFPKWVFAVAGGAIVIALLALFILPGLISKDTGDVLTPGLIVKDEEDVSTSGLTSRDAGDVFPLAGIWAGDVDSSGGGFSIAFDFNASCEIGKKCGTFEIPEWSQSGDIIITKTEGSKYYIKASNKTNESEDVSYEEWLRYISDNEIEYYAEGSYGVSNGILYKDLTFVFWDCEEETVSSNDNLAIYHYWLAVEESQVDDYFNAASYSITLNDKPASIKQNIVGELEQDPEGVKSRYWMTIGKLPPGEYQVATTLVIEQKVFDGWDWFGPGTKYSGLTHYCQLIVN